MILDSGSQEDLHLSDAAVRTSNLAILHMFLKPPVSEVNDQATVSPAS